MSLQKICTKVTVKSLVKLEVLFSRKKVCNAPPSFFQTPHNSLIRTAGGEAKVSVFSMSSEVILMSSQSSGTTGLLLSSYY